MTDDELLAWLEERDNKKNDRVITYLLEQGRPDLAKQLEDRIKTIRMGTYGAIATWTALSPAQKTVVHLLHDGAHLVSMEPLSNRFKVVLPQGTSIPRAVLGTTVRNLLHRELISWAPDKKVILTERGRFVLKFGQGGQP